MNKFVLGDRIATQMKWKVVSLLTMLIIAFAVNVAIANSLLDPLDKESSRPVILDGKELFRISVRVGAFMPEERAKMISERLVKVAQDYSLDIDSLRIKKQEEDADIVIGNRIIMTITENDAKAEQQTVIELTQERLEITRAAIERYREERTTRNIASKVIIALLLTAILVGVFRLISRFVNLLRTRLTDCDGNICRYSFKIQKYEILNNRQAHNLIDRVLAAIKYSSALISIYFYLYFLLGIFPGTRKYANQLLDYIVSPIGAGIDGVIGYLPNLFIIGLIILVSRYVIAAIRVFFDEISKENIRIKGFYKEWSEPTYNIIRFLVLALTLISIFPYIPGSHSPVFQGISVLLGVLFSLGSTSAISNIIAGLALTYTRAFTIGDRVKIGDNKGDVLEKTLLVTRLRTIKNVDISIHNSLILNSPIINYSRATHETNLILHTSITIGYDAPWRTVHALLISAAQATENILAEPKPFVLQTSLDDFYITYEINAYTDKPRGMAKTYSELHQNIQDAFNEANLEIMSPHYTSIRDGNQTTIPIENLPDDYDAPVFIVQSQTAQRRKTKGRES